MAAANYGGYDYSFVKKKLEKFTCNTICTKVLRDPHLTKCCGQSVCESCLNYWFTKHRKESCPHCRAEGEEFQHFLDKRLKREIDSLRTRCTNKEEGCQWVGELGSLKDHLKSAKGCGYVRLWCPNKCVQQNQKRTVVDRKDLKDHLVNECYLRPYPCEHCGVVDRYENITGKGNSLLEGHSHYATCPEFPLECPNECGLKDTKRKDMEHHLHQQCPEEEVECTNRCGIGHLSGYYTTIMKRKDLALHLEEECELRPYQCQYCLLLGTYKDIIIHYDKCPEFPLECPNECGANFFIKRIHMDYHRSQCPEEGVECPFEEAGCDMNIVRRELEQHLATTQQQHLLMVMGAYKELKQTNAELKKANIGMEQSNEEMKQANAEMKQEMKKELEDHKEQIAKLTRELAQLRTK